MSGKKYLKILFSLVCIIFAFLIVIFYIVHDLYDDNSLSNKEYLITQYSPKIIFSGDSRAERQLNPIYAQNKLSMKKGDIVNIAVSSGDTLMIEKLISKYPKVFKNATLIISISQNQLNDGSKKIGYFSSTMISKMGFFEQLKTFYPNDFHTLLKYYEENIKKQLSSKRKNKNNEEFKNTLGFHPIKGIFDINTHTIDTVNKNPWYENYYNSGIKINLLKNSLINIKSNVKQLYVYTAPLSPKFLDTIKNTKYDTIEKSMQKSLHDLCNELNINYRSYSFDKRFKNEYFYDSAHLNFKGADIFTDILLEDLQSVK